MKKENSKNNSKKMRNSVQFGSVNYPVGDFLIRLKNAAIAKNHDIEVRNTRMIYDTAKVLQKSGYISGIKEKEGNLLVNLTYAKKEPILIDVRLVSKPGIRVYMSVKELKEHRGPSLIIVSTPRGLMTGSDALKSNIGGEVIAEVK